MRGTLTRFERIGLWTAFVWIWVGLALTIRNLVLAGL